MALILEEIMKLPILSGFQLVAGKSGLRRSVREMGILDHEYADILQEPLEADGIFAPGSFVLASLLFAKDAPEKILPAFKQLLIDGCCAVAVKDVYYKELPKEVLEFADDENFPVFMYNHTDMENIIYEVYAAINQQKNLFSLESILIEIIEGTSTPEQKESLTKELFGNLSRPYHCEYSLFAEAIDNLSYEKIFTELNGKQIPGHRFFPYRRGILTVVAEQHMQNVGWRREIPRHVTGTGNPCAKWIEFPYAAIESISAAKYAQMRHLSKKIYSELGIYKILLPNQENYWLTLLCQDATNKIRNVDPSGELWETAVEYVDQGMDANRTAKVLILHNNTVRYRIAKIARLMGYEEEKLEFRVVLYLVVKRFQCNL